MNYTTATHTENADVSISSCDGDRPLATFKWDAHQGLVRLLLQRNGIPRSESDDAAQEAMEALWMARDRYDPSRGSSATFVGLVMKGFCSNYRRSLKKRAAQQSSDLWEDRRARPIPANRAEGSAVNRAMQALSAQNQEVLRLRFAACLSESQAARVAGMPIDQFRARIRQAIKELQRAMINSSELDAAEAA